MGVTEDMYAGTMLLMMMVAAPQHHIDKLGRPCGVRHQIVDLAPRSRDLSTQPAATTVTYQQRPILIVARETHHGAQIKNP